MGGAGTSRRSPPRMAPVKVEELRTQGAYLEAVAPIPSVEWGAVVMQLRSLAEGSADRFLRLYAAMIPLAVAAAAALAWWLGQGLRRDWEGLALEARRLRGGDLRPGLLEKLGSTREVSDVASSLAEMARTLEAQRLERERSHRRALRSERLAAERERLASLGQLSAGLAHELNNPLAVIAAAAEEAGRGSAGPRRRWLGTIRSEAARAASLVRDLLAYARPLHLRLAPCDLGALCQDAFEQASQGRAIVHRLRIQGAPLRAHLDSQRSKQVLINLFTNALDASPKGGELSVRLMRRGPLVLARVRDQGAGLPKGPLEGLFRPFFTTKASGTGLGLAISRGILRAHGGDLRARRPRGRGAEFTALWSEHPQGGRHGG